MTGFKGGGIYRRRSRICLVYYYAGAVSSAPERATAAIVGTAWHTEGCVCDSDIHVPIWLDKEWNVTRRLKTTNKSRMQQRSKS